MGALSKFRNEVRSPADGALFLSRLAIPADPRARQMTSWLWGRLPRQTVIEAIGLDVASAEITLLNALTLDAGHSLTVEELTVLLGIARSRNARRVLEVGTFDGNTALNLAANTPADATITTIDLPKDSTRDDDLSDAPVRFRNLTDRGRVASRYADTPFEAKICQVWGDSTALNWGDFVPDPLDLVFIDGCHHHNYVQSDTENALRLLASDGVIIWHDYGYFKDVTDYVEGSRLPVRAIAGTRFAVYVNGSSLRRPKGSY